MFLESPGSQEAYAILSRDTVYASKSQAEKKSPRKRYKNQSHPSSQNVSCLKSLLDLYGEKTKTTHFSI